jgi:hypothetical protein
MRVKALLLNLTLAINNLSHLDRFYYPERSEAQQAQNRPEGLIIPLYQRLCEESFTVGLKLTFIGE